MGSAEKSGPGAAGGEAARCKRNETLRGYFLRAPTLPRMRSTKSPMVNASPLKNCPKVRNSISTPVRASNGECPKSLLGENAAVLGENAAVLAGTSGKRPQRHAAELASRQFDSCAAPRPCS